jgi:hypothetical protein
MAVLLLLIVVAGCGLCGDQVMTEVPSPAKKYVATLFERNCGATTSYVRVVTLRPFGDKLNSGRTKDWVFVTEGQPTMRLTWKDDKSLEVYFSGGASVSRQQGTWKDVKISYE